MKAFQGPLDADWRRDLVLTDPNYIQLIPLQDIRPSEMNVRLFIERESLHGLEQRYRQYIEDEEAVLPDPPLVRFHGLTAPLELLAGHRRVQAAANVGLQLMPCRVVCLDSEAAYRIIREANNYEILTTIERAYAVAEMDRLGFSGDQIRESLGNIGLKRYLQVGRLVHPDWFTDAPKLCDPSITIWGYAATHGAEHFRYCFKQWNTGTWDEEDCQREFKRVGQAPPPEPYQAGAIMSVDPTGKVLRFRGTLDLGKLSLDEIKNEVISPLMDRLADAVEIAGLINNFGEKRNYRFAPGHEVENE
jgi:hypothetical protein